MSTTEPSTPRRRSFAPVVLAGLASAALASVAGTKPWATGAAGRIDTSSAAYASTLKLTSAQEMPLAGALGLLVLACWGVLLVTRGRVRRLVAVLGLVGAAALAITTVAGFGTVQDTLGDALLAASGEDTADVSLTGWYAVAALAALACLATSALAAAWTPGWPEMGRRYDAPTSGSSETPAEGERDPLDLWKALDEGRDPTAGGPS